MGLEMIFSARPTVEHDDLLSVSAFRHGFHLWALFLRGQATIALLLVLRLLSVSSEVYACSYQVFASDPSRLCSAHGELRIHEHVANRPRRSITDAIVISHVAYNDNYFAHLSNQRQVFGRREIFNRELPVPVPWTTTTPEHDMPLPTQWIIVPMQWFLVGEGFNHYGQITGDVICNGFTKVLARESVGRWVAKVAVRLAPENGSGIRRDNRLSKLVGGSHLARLASSESRIEDQNYDANKFNWLQPRLIFRTLINLMCIAIVIGLMLGCVASGLFIIQNEVPRQPDCDSAWLALWLGIGILGVGQICGFLVIYLAGLWF